MSITLPAIVSEDDPYHMAETETDHTDLSAMTVGELHSLYRQWPLRHRQRAKDKASIIELEDQLAFYAPISHEWKSLFIGARTKSHFGITRSAGKH